MSDQEDDYLSDKFLIPEEPTPKSKSKTYSELRKDAAKQAQIKNEQNRLKSKAQLERESRQDGLSKSLFERAKEDETAGYGSNKALQMMLKMGFKPGDSLGSSAAPSNDESPKEDTHIKEPLRIDETGGKTGIGSRKRARPASPTSAERIAKMAKLAEDSKRETYISRAREEYEERRAEGRLTPAQRTLANLDEKQGITFNVLSLNPQAPHSLPEGLLEELGPTGFIFPSGRNAQSEQTRLKLQMEQESLRPLSSALDEVDEISKKPTAPTYSAETIDEVIHFFKLRSIDRLSLVLGYLRDRHCYCFWCGTEYADAERMAEQCPGTAEDDHD